MSLKNKIEHNRATLYKISHFQNVATPLVTVLTVRIQILTRKLMQESA
jgi:hypothetical protein